jgi:hypothetical protein
MSRQLKRVPMDFDWPLHKVWSGYLTPYSSQDCPYCERSGYNEETRKISEGWYAFDNPRYVWLDSHHRYNDNAWKYHLTEVEIDALWEQKRLRDFEKKPTPEEFNEYVKHDFFFNEQYVCVKARAEHLGVYGECPHCDGEGYTWQSEEVQRLAEEWRPIDPPAGDGYQLWEDCSEGSPVSPVFATLEELCAWCETGATTFGSFRATKEQWMEMLSGGMVHHKETYPNGISAIFC